MPDIGDRQRRVVVVDGVEYPLWDSHAMQVGSPKYRVVNRVVDSLYVRCWRPNRPSSFVEDHLEEWREQPELVKLPGLSHFELTRGGENYEFKFYNPAVAEIRLWRSEIWHKKACQDTGQLYVTFRSRFMQFAGIAGANRFLDLLEGLFFAPEMLQAANMPDAYRVVSRADISVDYEMPEVLTWERTGEYVARGSRLKLDAWLSPFADDIEKVVSRVLHNSETTIRRKQNEWGSITYPGGDNKGGLNDIPKLDGFTGNEVPALPVDPGAPMELALAHTLKMFAKWVEEQFETRGYSDLERTIGTQKQIQTLYFGRFKSELYAREYNKQLEMIVSDKGYLLDIWAKNGWTLEVPVWRLEFSVSADVLKSWPDLETGEFLDLREPMTLLEYLPDVWAYLTRTWLRHTVPNPNDSKRDRWEPSERWKALQGAWGEDSRITRSKQYPKPDSDKLQRVARSYLGGATAISAHFEDELAKKLRLSAKEEDRLGYEQQLEAAQTAAHTYLNQQAEWSETNEFVTALLKGRRARGLDLAWLLEEKPGAPLTATKRREQIAARLALAKSRFHAMLDNLRAWVDGPDFFDWLLERRKRRGLDAPTDAQMSALVRVEQIQRGAGS
jgi:hypothetical protein